MTRVARSLMLCAFALALMTALAPAASLAQTNIGQITGRITDASGAAVPGATVTALSAQTGLVTETVSDHEGLYRFPSLPAGTYTIKAELSGFRSVEVKYLVLDAASRRSVDLQLEVGDISETVTVGARANQVETQSGDVTRVITGEQVNNIALNGRNYAQLLQLLPGAVIQSTDPFAIGLSTTGQAINGVRSNSIYRRPSC